MSVPSSFLSHLVHELKIFVLLNDPTTFRISNRRVSR